MKMVDLISAEILSLWVVEYSPIQRCLHICTVDETLGNNLEIIFKCPLNELPGFIPIFITDSAEKAQLFVEKLEKRLNNEVP